MSLRLQITGALMRPVVRAVMRRMDEPSRARRHLERSARYMFRAPPSALYSETRYTAGRALWVSSGPVRENRLLFYIHGGGYLAGSPDTHKKMVARLCRLTGMRAFLPGYRLAPEHTVPAALEDIRQAWTHLMGMGYASDQIVIGGDSAGGGLAMALLSELCLKDEAPAGVFVWSPFLDQTFSGASVVENGKRDHFFPSDRVHDLAEMVLGETAADDPRASPLFADFPDCPPVLIQTSHTEILRDDAIRMEAKLREGGAEVRLEMWEDAPHVWQIFDGWFPEAREAIGNTARWISSLSSPKGES